MASDGVLNMLLDDHTPPNGIVPIRVCRESTINRTETLPLWVPAEALAPSHVWRHVPIAGPVFYELAHPAIFRVGLLPGEVLSFVGNEAHAAERVIKRFGYVVIGDCTDPLSIMAPFNEEDTRLIFKIESGSSLDPLTFWCEHVNTDQFSMKVLESQQFAPRL